MAKREDAVLHAGREYVPTSSATKWIDSFAKFMELAGGELVFNEDQTELKLRLPAPYKFSIQFER